MWWILGALAFFIVFAFFIEWVDRRFVARLQDRYGPIYTGIGGVLQPWADFIKLLSKEDITPAASDKVLFRLTPLALPIFPIMGLCLTPILGKPIMSFDGDLIVAIFLMSVYTIMIFIAGYGSGNSFGIVGGTRAALQMLGYEVPFALAMIGPAILAGTLSISEIAYSQKSMWYAIPLALGFAVFMVCTIAEVHVVPFDIPHAKQEIVAGWETEYSGRKLALIHLAENLEMVFISALATALFLGGGYGPFSPPIPPAVWFITKTLIVAIVISNLRAIFARFKIITLVEWSWKYLLPLAIVQLLVLELFFELGVIPWP